MLSVIVAAAITVMLVAAPAGAQARQRAETAPAPSAAPYAQPRTPDGQPDIQGFWRVVPGGTYSIEDMSLQQNGGGNFADRSPGGTRIVDPPNGRVPYQPWAFAIQQEILKNHMNPEPYQLDPQSRCWLQGVPRGMYQSESNIIQTPGQILIVHEYSHTYRVIPTIERPRLPENMRLFMGDPHARWEGNELVIENYNLNDIPWFDLVGSFHSDALHVTERLTRVDDMTMRYTVTMEDPKMYTRPWTMAFVMKRNTEKNYEQWEHACYEGERSLQRVLSRATKKN
jgi:hypothetical protein